MRTVPHTPHSHGTTAFVMAAHCDIGVRAAIIVNVISIRRFRRKSRQAANVSRIMEHALELEHIRVVRFMMATITHRQRPRTSYPKKASPSRNTWTRTP